MTKYIDIDGREWPDAQLALEEFLNDLPSLSENEMEALTIHTLSTESAAFNLRAMKRAIDEDYELTKLFEGYPVPHPALKHGLASTLAASPFISPFVASCQCGRTFQTSDALRDHVITENAADLEE